MRARVASMCLVMLALVGCGKKDPNGVGPWQFGVSTLKDAEEAGRCLPIDGGLMHCIGLATMQVGGQAAEVQLYFASKEKSAELLEIELSVRACDAANVSASLEQVMQPAPAKKNADGTMVTWSLSTMFVRALTPEKGSGACRINFVTPKDKKRIADLEAGQ